MRTHATYYYSRQNCRSYGLSNFVGDITLTVMTGGLWIFWWIIREIKR